MYYNETSSYIRVIIMTTPRDAEHLPSVERLKEVLQYSPETGKFFRITKGDVRLKPTGSVCRGYLLLCVDGKRFFAHRAAWAMHYGEWPKSILDHLNCDTSDNRIHNLRLATKTQNNQNRGKSKANTSGFKGVYWHKKAQKWYSTGVVDGKQKYLGLFERPEDASSAYESFQREHAKEFMRID